MARRNIRRGMSRKRFIGTGAAGVGAAAVGLGGVARAATISVPGPGDHNTIQQAIDDAKTGDTLVLSGTFDFGPTGSVTIDKALTITGPATILNGTKPFNVGKENGAAGDVTIENLAFFEPNDGAIFVWRNNPGNTVTIRYNTIEHTLHNKGTGPLWSPDAEMTDYYDEARPHHYTAIYTWSGGTFEYVENPDKYGRAFGYVSRSEPSVAGTVIIENNMIDLEAGKKPSPGVFEHYSFGVGMWGAHADVIVQGNVIKNCSSKSIVVEDNAGTTTVQGNTIYQGPVGSTRSSSYSTWGIDTEYGWNWFGKANNNKLPQEAKAQVVSGNTVMPLPGYRPVPGALGIGVFGNSAAEDYLYLPSGDYSFRISSYICENNTIELTRGAWGISVGDQDGDAVVQNNTIKGTAHFAFYPFMYWYAHNITYSWNDLNRFKFLNVLKGFGKPAHVFWETYTDGSDITYNVVEEDEERVRRYARDQGQNNTFPDYWTVDYE